MQSLGATQHSSQGIRHGEVIIIMRMKIEMGIRIALDHLTEVLNTLQGIHDSQRIWEHEPPDTTVTELIHQMIDIRR